ncbi:uncharacterized protein [Chelonus insularis]|uniref:uncharacterized protein n=1 Tax=Chelonus insularis TaxID=460826 RepID=UPI00158A1762|nr:uncharacterized protein LOC118072326 [Chelonus insularis]
MKYWIILINISLIYFSSYPSVVGGYTCHPDDCVSSSVCDIMDTKAEGGCDTETQVCCLMVNTEFRNKCSHYQGECMDSCDDFMTQKVDVDDCPDGSVCCAAAL